VLLALDFRASRGLALSPELARYRVLHFATHGFLDTDHPELSGLALSLWDDQGQPQDGFLRLQDIYGLRLRADLVVLSGCETALGQRLGGEGLLGLTHGFLHAGTAQVVASLWEVRDRATAELMERFYRALYRDGLRPAAALRRAQVEMWRQRPWRDPYYWAAFTLQGDW
jgi:CHAT domain-containing protein